MDYNKIRKQEKRGKNIAAIIMIAITAAVILSVVIVSVIMTSQNRKDGGSLIHDNHRISHPTAAPYEEAEPTAVADDTVLHTPEPLPQRRGTAQPIPDDIREYMSGKSMHSNNNISYDDLSYLTVPHYDFNGGIAEGHMVINAALAEELLDIFAELYDIQYPIERMELIDKYDADDYTSIEFNNTSAFNYRVSTDGSNRLSRHALGRAVDINPQINPYVSSDGTGSHSNAAEYWSRNYQNWSSDVARRAYIGPEAEIYNIFVNKYGWEWGGSWSSYRDYQHFQKP